MDSLVGIETDDAVLFYLLQNFLNLKNKFKSKRRSSGMPKEVISSVNKSNELYFVITGSKAHKPYKVEKVFSENKELIKDDLPGITAARRFIAQYVNQNKELPFEYQGDLAVINDYCCTWKSRKKEFMESMETGVFFKILIAPINPKGRRMKIRPF